MWLVTTVHDLCLKKLAGVSCLRGLPTNCNRLTHSAHTCGLCTPSVISLWYNDHIRLHIFFCFDLHMLKGCICITSIHSFMKYFYLWIDFFMESIHHSHCCLPSDHYHRYHAVVCGDEWVLFNAAQVSSAGQFHIPPCLPTPVGAVITYSLAMPFRCRPGVHVWYRPWSGKLWRNKLFCLP